MNIQINARQYSSAAEMAAEAKARRKRFETAGRRPKQLVRAAIESTKIEVLPARQEPAWEGVYQRFDHHVTEWKLRLANPPLTYLKDRCKELGVPYAVIIGLQRRREVVDVRHRLIWEISQSFGISLPALGRMFGGRDHTTILHSIRRFISMNEGNLPEIESARP